jgi:hypothetical protein
MMGYAFLRDEEVELACAADADLVLGGGDSRSSQAVAEQSLAEIRSYADRDGEVTRTSEAADGGDHADPAAHSSVDAGGSQGDHDAAAPAHDWRKGARAYNAAHHALVEQFNAVTGDACGSGSDVDPEQIARWQKTNGVSPDGRVGPRTFHAARRLSVARTAAASKGNGSGSSSTGANAATGATGSTATTTIAATTSGATKAPVPATPKVDGTTPVAAKPSGPSVDVQLRAQYASILKQYTLQQVSEPEAVGKLLAYDKKLNDGSVSLTGMMMVPFLLADLVKIAVARTAKSSAGATTGGSGQGPDGATAKADDHKPIATGEPFSHVYTAGTGRNTQQCQVYVSPGGVTATPDVFIFFHGHRAQYHIDGKQQGKGEISGLDVAADAMTHARGKNTIAILPQGKLGSRAVDDDRTTEGGYMAALQGGLPAFVTSVLTPLAADLHMASLTPRHISLAGHSAGGYMGIHDALRKAGSMADAITDVTLMDTGYATSHFDDTAAWMYSGSPGKSVRIIGSAKQITATQKHTGAFSPGALAKAAKAHGFTVQDVGVSGDQRDKDTKVVQHSRIMKEGMVQCDVLIMMFDQFHDAGRDHAPLRDRVMDDAILSIGEGAAGNDTFGTRDKGGEPGAAPQPALVTKPVVHMENKPKDATSSGAGHDDHVKEATKHVEAKHQDGDHAEPAKAKAKAKSKAHAKHAYDSDNGVDSFGNETERGGDLRGQKSHATTFATPFTVVRDGALYDDHQKSLKKKLPKGAEVFVKDMKTTWVKITCNDPAAPIAEADNVWIKFASLGGIGHDIGFGNEHSDPKDKERADKIREGLPAGRHPGESKHKWMFSGHFMPSLDGVSLSGSLMTKVHALMEWAIANDMVLGDISIGSGMRSPKSAHYLCVRYEIANMDSNNRVTLAALKALPGGRDPDGNKWYEEGWTEQQAIDNAKDLLKKAGASGKVAAAGYNPGDARRAPLPINGRPGVSNHCSGHAVDVDIPWRSPDDPNKVDLWAWEQVYHQFGLTRPLHKDRGGKSSTQESWHIEETGKELEDEGAAAG